MGTLVYEKTTIFEFDARALTHLEAVIRAKLGRDEPFMMTVPTRPVDGSGRTSVWVNRDSALVFKFRGPRVPLNHDWFRALLAAANSPAGLSVVPEPIAAVDRA